MEQEYKKLAEKLCKDKACKIQYCLQGVFIHLCNLIGSDLTRWFDQHIAYELCMTCIGMVLYTLTSHF